MFYIFDQRTLNNYKRFFERFAQAETTNIVIYMPLHYMSIHLIGIFIMAVHPDTGKWHNTCLYRLIPANG